MHGSQLAELQAELSRQTDATAAALEAERLKRVEHLQSVALRRLVHAELARGWGAWLHTYETQAWPLKVHVGILRVKRGI